MMFADTDIAQAVLQGRLALDPFDPSAIQPASVDVHLGPGFLVFNSHRYECIDPAVEQPGLTELVEVDPFVLHPGEFVLGATLERVELAADLAARLEGKSSLGRLGLQVHATAGWVDPGFAGWVTLELSNVAQLPILLYPGMRIGQLCLFPTMSQAVRPYGHAGNKYQNQQRGPQPSLSHVNFRRAVTGVRS